MRRLWISGAMFGVACLLVGCSGDLDATVTGKVTVDDQDVPLGEVTFYPADGDTTRWTPRAVIGSDGEYELKVGAKRGLPSGQYKVAVQAMDKLGPAKPNQAPAAKMLSPLRYGNPDTSGFEFTVKPGSNTINLPLKSK